MDCRSTESSTEIPPIEPARLEAAAAAHERIAAHFRALAELLKPAPAAEPYRQLALTAVSAAGEPLYV